jgi:hypothetical protein
MRFPFWKGSPKAGATKRRNGYYERARSQEPCK